MHQLGSEQRVDRDSLPGLGGDPLKVDIYKWFGVDLKKIKKKYNEK